MGMQPMEWTENALIKRSTDFGKLCALHERDPEAASAKLETMMQTVRTMLEHVGVADVNNVEQASIITEILTKKFRAMHDREPETTEETNLIRSFAQIHARVQQAHAALQRQNGDKDTSNKSPNAPHDNAVPPAA
ncbi:hypothetical protein GX553_02325 [Candidatus Peribacteria bacterium]|nr:hypothetical protein [Candidatus Peribacteria bacterium]